MCRTRRSKRSRVLVAACRWSLLLPLLAGCTVGNEGSPSQSRTRNPLLPSEIAKVRKVGLHVVVERPFEVIWIQTGDPDTTTMVAAGVAGGLIGGVLAGFADTAIRDQADRRHARPMEAQMAGLDLREELAVALAREIDAGQLGITTEWLSSTNRAQIEKQGCDAALYVNVLRWGVEPCENPAVPGETATNQLAQAKMDLRLSLIERRSNRRLWERLEYHVPGDCRPLDDFKNEDGMLRARFEQGVARVAAAIVDEIRQAAAPAQQ